jgi:hypothetical protein
MALFDTPFYGSDLQKGKLWTAGTIVSQGPAEAEIAESYVLDMSLPNQGVQPHPESLELDYVKIPRGRFVGIASRGMSVATEAPMLTLANGASINPIGMTWENVLSSASSTRPTQLPRWRKNGYFAVPYLQAINDLHGTLMEGDYVSAYYGATSASAGVFAYEDRGKPVKWIPKKVYWETVASATTVPLASALLVGVQPEVIVGLDAANAPVAFTSVQYNTTLNSWTATFAAAVVRVVYSYGQSAAAIGGQIGRMIQVSSTSQYAGWLKWVEQDWQAAPSYLPQMYDYPTQAVGFDSAGAFVLGSAEVPTATSTPGVFKLANGRIAPHKKIVVYVVTGAIMGLDGTLTNVSGQPLTLNAGAYFENFSIGAYYRVDIGLGYVQVSDQLRRVDGSPIQASDLKVAYNFDFKYEYGRRTILGDGVGMRGLTDGRFTGIAGVPAWLEREASDRRFSTAAGAFGEMRIMFQ